MTNWGFSALSILLFPIIKAHLPKANPAPMFVFFATWSLVALLINHKYVVETRNKTSIEIRDGYVRLQKK